MRSIVLRVLVTGCLVATSASGQTSSAPYAFWTFAGRATTAGATDGSALNARFNRPWGVAVDPQGNVYVSEAINHTIRKITPAGNVTTLAGQATAIGATDGAGNAARFSMIGTSPISNTSLSPIGPYGVAIDSSGFLFVADGNNHTVRRVDFAGNVTTFSGQAGNGGTIDGPVAAALYQNPTGVAVDVNGNVFIADTFNHVIRRIAPNGVVSTIAGRAGIPGATDGVGSAARFLHPVAIATSANGNVYVADSANVIRRLSPISGAQDTWSVTTFAGFPLTYGTTDGVGSDARFGGAPSISSSGGVTIGFPSFSPISSAFGSIGSSYRMGDISGLAVDAAGNVYVADFSNNLIRRVSATGVVTTIGGSISGSADGVGSAVRFQRPCGIAVDAAGTLYIADSFNHTIRKGAIAAAPLIQTQPSGQNTTAGSNIVLQINATGSPPPSFQWALNGQSLAGATNSTLTLNNVQASQGGTYTATITNAVGSVVSTPAVLTVNSAPIITSQPASRSVLGGQSVTLSVTVVAFPPPTYQWLRNGVPLPGQTSSILTFSEAQDTIAADYRVLITNTFGTTTSGVATLAVDTGRVVNLSVRSALSGADPLIAGFVVAGGTKPLLIRAVGPTLREFGVTAAMADPQLRLEIPGTVLATNDNWSTATNAAQVAGVSAQVGAFPLPENSLDSAAFATVSSNAVSAHVSARNNAGGVVLLELYDTGAATAGRLVNVSTRAHVGVGENALFAGFSIGGNSPRTLLIRAIGPTLGAFGVTNVLSDPLLEVFAFGVTAARATNDNWDGDATLTAAFARAGAFSLPATSSKDAALIATFEPGSYSAKVSGVGGTTGEVLLEIYELP